MNWVCICRLPAVLFFFCFIIYGGFCFWWAVKYWLGMFVWNVASPVQWHVFDAIQTTWAWLRCIRIFGGNTLQPVDASLALVLLFFLISHSLLTNFIPFDNSRFGIQKWYIRKTFRKYAGIANIFECWKGDDLFWLIFKFWKKILKEKKPNF